MSDLIVFAVIGLLTGAAARLCYPGREAWQALVTMLVSTVGAVLAGMISWAVWPAEDGQLYPGALLTALLGALLALGVWAGVSYYRRISAPSR